MSASSNAGTTQRHLNRLRTEDVTPTQAMGYESGGIAAPVVGDEEGPWLKVPPFATLPQLWGDFTFTAAAYVPLDVLDTGQVRTVTTLFNVTGLALNNTSQLSIVGGTYLPTAPGELITLANFYTIAVIDPTPTTVTLLAPFNAPAISRTVTNGELRTQAIPLNDVLRFVIQWDVAPYQNFALYLRDLSATPLSKVRVHYAYAS